MKHKWWTLNRAKTEPKDMSIDDILAESRAALAVLEAGQVERLANDLDIGHYDAVGRTVAKMLRSLSAEAQTGNPFP